MTQLVEISEDHQLVLLERGASTFVATFDGHRGH